MMERMARPAAAPVSYLWCFYHWSVSEFDFQIESTGPLNLNLTAAGREPRFFVTACMK